MSTQANDIQFYGPQRSGALQRFNRQMTEWGLVMPPVEPLVLDFGLSDFARIGLIEYWIANEMDAGYCGKYLFLFDGQRCPMHHHLDKHETFFIVKGKLKMDFDGTTRAMGPGDLLVVDVNRPHSFVGVGPVLILEVSKPCLIEDNYFADRNIPIGGNYKVKTR